MWAPVYEPHQAMEEMPESRSTRVTPQVSSSDLAKNSKRVADTVERAQRVHVTRRDSEGLHLTTKRRDSQRQETADVTARLFAALISSGEGARAVLSSLPQVFPWARHPSAEEVRAFVVDLVNTTRDATELDVHANLRRIIVEWRATASVLADPE